MTDSDERTLRLALRVLDQALTNQERALAELAEADQEVSAATKLVAAFRAPRGAVVHTNDRILREMSDVHVENWVPTGPVEALIGVPELPPHAQALSVAHGTMVVRDNVNKSWVQGLRLALARGDLRLPEVEGSLRVLGQSVSWYPNTGKRTYPRVEYTMLSAEAAGQAYREARTAMDAPVTRKHDG